MMIRNRQFKWMGFVLLVALAFVLTGCATSEQFKTLEAQVQQALQKSDRAMQTAESAKMATADCAAQVEKCNDAAMRAQQAADKAETAAQDAENSARKAEAIFMKKMKK